MGRPQAISRDNEERRVEGLIYFANYGFGFTNQLILDAVQNFVANNPDKYSDFKGGWDWLYGCSVEGFSTDRRGRAVGSAVHSIEATDGTRRSASVSLEKITMKDNILNKRNFLMRKLCFFYLLFSIDRHGTGTGTSIKD